MEFKISVVRDYKFPLDYKVKIENSLKNTENRENYL